MRTTKLPPEFGCFRNGLLKPDPFQEGAFRVWADTNMHMGEQLNPPYQMLVERIILLFQPSCKEADRNAFLENYRWGLSVCDKTLATSVALDAAYEGDIATVIEDFGEIGGQAITGRFGWSIADHPIYIPPLCPFGFFFQGRNTLEFEGTLDMYVILDGIWDCPPA